METTSIIRKSVHLFLQHYQFFAGVTLFFFPASASILLSVSSPSWDLIFNLRPRIASLLEAGGFPDSRFTSFLHLKLSQAVASFLTSFPFTVSFLLLGKACVISHALHTGKASSPGLRCSLPSIWKKLLITYLTSVMFIFVANATAFSFLFLAFNIFDILGESSSPVNPAFLSCVGSIFYSVVLANTIIICNLAIIVSGMEKRSGIVAILRACILIKNRAAIALSLALPVNLCLAAIESLFQYRVVRMLEISQELPLSVAWEGPLLIHMYSTAILLDTNAGCIFYNYSKSLYHSESRYMEEKDATPELFLPTYVA